APLLETAEGDLYLLAKYADTPAVFSRRVESVLRALGFVAATELPNDALLERLHDEGLPSYLRVAAGIVLRERQVSESQIWSWRPRIQEPQLDHNESTDARCAWAKSSRLRSMYHRIGRLIMCLVALPIVPVAAIACFAAYGRANASGQPYGSEGEFLGGLV